MNPSDYFPDKYLEDLKIFSGETVHGTGPRYMLCGRTFEKILGYGYRRQYQSLEGFISTTYCLNLINQGIHAYFNKDFYSWCENSVPFPDCQSCSHFHGGISRPFSIIRYSENPHVGKPVYIDRIKLKNYLNYFFNNYLKNLNCFIETTPSKLGNVLFYDKDCPMFRELWDFQKS